MNTSPRLSTGTSERSTVRFGRPIGPAESEANPPEVLCGYHATQATGAYVGFGWSVHADRLNADDEAIALLVRYRDAWDDGARLTLDELKLKISSLVNPGTNTTPTGC